MATNEVFRNARTKLGLTQAEVARRSGLSVNEYSDVEHHGDEALRVVHLRSLRSLSEVLQLDLVKVFGIECAFCGKKEASRVGAARPRNEVIREARAGLALSQADLADRIGFEPRIVERMEANPDFLEGWSLELVVSLAGVLKVQAQVLLNVRCRRCGR
jgi:transcriptional regulator with XRE-family HTH domain